MKRMFFLDKEYWGSNLSSKKLNPRETCQLYGALLEECSFVRETQTDNGLLKSSWKNKFPDLSLSSHQKYFWYLLPWAKSITKQKAETLWFIQSINHFRPLWMTCLDSMSSILFMSYIGWLTLNSYIQSLVRLFLSVLPSAAQFSQV